MSWVQDLTPEAELLLSRPMKNSYLYCPDVCTGTVFELYCFLSTTFFADKNTPLLKHNFKTFKNKCVSKRRLRNFKENSGQSGPLPVQMFARAYFFMGAISRLINLICLGDRNNKIMIWRYLGSVYTYYKTWPCLAECLHFEFLSSSRWNSTFFGLGKLSGPKTMNNVGFIALFVFVAALLRVSLVWRACK